MMCCNFFFFQDVHNHVVNAQFSLGKKMNVNDILCFMICSQLQVVFF